MPLTPLGNRLEADCGWLAVALDVNGSTPERRPAAVPKAA